MIIKKKSRKTWKPQISTKVISLEPTFKRQSSLLSRHRAFGLSCPFWKHEDEFDNRYNIVNQKIK